MAETLRKRFNPAAEVTIIPPGIANEPIKNSGAKHFGGDLRATYVYTYPTIPCRREEGKRQPRSNSNSGPRMGREKVECSCTDTVAGSWLSAAAGLAEFGWVASQFRGEGGARDGGSGVDEQFAWRRTLWLSAVGARLPLHRRGRDKLGVEDAGKAEKGKVEEEERVARRQRQKCGRNTECC